MEQGFSKTKFVMLSPRKARITAALMRNLPVEQAALQLAACGQKAGIYLRKTLESAVANAEMQSDVRREDLVVLDVRVDDGPRHKRGKARSRGSRSPILKRMSHLTVVVGTKEV